MNRRLIELHRQQGRLLERSAGQRAALGRQLAPLRSACRSADYLLATGREALRLARRHPAVVTAAVATFVILKPRWAWRFFKRGLALWRGWRILDRLPEFFTAFY